MTTKEQEKTILGKIEALINETEPGSYIRMAFCGCVRLAQENIEYDFGNSYPEMIEWKDKQISDLSSEVSDLKHDYAIEEKAYLECLETIKKKDAEIADIKEQRDALNDCVNGLNEIVAESERMLADKDAEIVRLKAKLFDLMFAEK